MIVLALGLAAGLAVGILLEDLAHRVERSADRDDWTAHVDDALLVANDKPALRVVS